MKNRRNPFFPIIFAAVLVCIFGVFDTVKAQSNCSGSQIFTAKNCTGDANSGDEKTLLQLVNKYRVANKQSELRLSAPLSMLANRRILDMKQNMKMLTHSWSNCPYDIKVEKTWPCVIDAPQRLNTGYKGQGYETLYRVDSGSATPSLALAAWQKSTLHNSIILNLDIFRNMAWEEAGVAINGQYAVLWFGHSGSGLRASGDSGAGLGVTYDQTVAGLSKILSINQTSSSVEDNKWQGLSPDKKIKLEIYGTRKEVSEADIRITAKLETTGKLAPQHHAAIVTLLKNIFPEWTDIDTWLTDSIRTIARDQSASKTKLVRKIVAEITSGGSNTLKLSVRPQLRQRAVEVF